MTVADEVYDCRDCRLDPKYQWEGWTDEDLKNMWQIAPAKRQWGGPPGMAVVIDVVPCAVHKALLEETYGKERGR